MSRWNIKTSGLFVLGCVIFFMLLIVVSPDVDLPDAAFHHGTAPAVVHAQVRTAPAGVPGGQCPSVPTSRAIAWKPPAGNTVAGEPASELPSNSVVLHSLLAKVLLPSYCFLGQSGRDSGITQHSWHRCCCSVYEPEITNVEERE